MKIDREIIWHFVCDYCKGYWSIAVMDEWKPNVLYCPHCGEKNSVQADNG